MVVELLVDEDREFQTVGAAILEQNQMPF